MMWLPPIGLLLAALAKVSAFASVDGRVGVAWSDMITLDEWWRRFDFLVKIHATQDRDDRVHHIACTGTLWQTHVLTAAHCGRQTVAWAVDVVTGSDVVSSYNVSKATTHPDWDGSANSAFDFMVLELDASHTNQRPVYLKSSPNSEGDQLIIAGLGMTADEDGNSHWPEYPVVSDPMSVVACPLKVKQQTASTVDCVASSPLSETTEQTSCSGDSGGPWLVSRPAEAAHVAGVNSFGYSDDSAHKNCGDPGKKSAFGSTIMAMPWIQASFPGVFQWRD